MDMRLGIYRLIYSGFLHGRRINSVSESTECFFWRLVALADDYGNFRADSIDLSKAAYPRRRKSPAAVADMLAKLANTEYGALIELYEVRGESYGHILGWFGLQPANRQGRRIRKVEAWSGEAQESANHLAETNHKHRKVRSGEPRGTQEARRGTQGNPTQSKPSESESDTDTELRIPPSREKPQTPPPGLELLPGVPEALAALDCWSLRDRQVGLQPAKNETQQVTRWVLDVLGSDPPLIHAGEQVSAVLMVPRVVDALMGKGSVPFKSPKYAMGCIRTELEDWRNRGVQASNQPRSSHTGGAGGLHRSQTSADQAAQRRADKAAAEYPEVGLTLPVRSYGGSKPIGGG